jgi:hypothetical protein
MKNKNRRLIRDNELKTLEKFLRQRGDTARPLRDIPELESEVTHRKENTDIIPGTSVISANLVSIAELLHGGLTPGGSVINLGTFTTITLGARNTPAYKVNADNQGLFCVTGFKNVSIRDQFEFSVWITGHTAGASGNANDYLLCIGDSGDEYVVVRYEVGTAKLRLYPNLKDNPTKYLSIDVANWTDTGTPRLLKCTLDYQNQAYTLVYDGVIGTGTTTGILPPEFGVGTVTSFFTDNSNANNGYHDFSYLYLGPIQGKTAAAAIAIPAADDHKVLVTDTELAADYLSNQIGNGAGIGLSVTGGAGADQTLQIACTITQYTDEMAEDAVGGILTGTQSIGFTYNDGANTISAKVLATYVCTYHALAILTTNGIWTGTWANSSNSAFIGHPDAPRGVTFSLSSAGAPGTHATGDLQINGIDANGVAVTENFVGLDAVSSPPTPATGTTTACMIRITSIVISNKGGTGTGTLIVGWNNTFGIPNGPLTATGDIFDVKQTTSGGTCTDRTSAISVTTAQAKFTGITIVAGDTLTIYYRVS